MQTGWTHVKQIFSGGQGVLYVVTHDGRLLWYKHNRYLDPVRAPGTGYLHPYPPAREALKIQWERSWEGPKEVGTGWNFKHVFSSGEGNVYAVTDDGRLLWYRHLAFEGGGPTWWQDQSGFQYKLLGQGWGGFPHAFAALSSPSELVVR